MLPKLKVKKDFGKNIVNDVESTSSSSQYDSSTDSTDSIDTENSKENVSEIISMRRVQKDLLDKNDVKDNLVLKEIREESLTGRNQSHCKTNKGSEKYNLVIEKRKMGFLTELNQVLGENADKLFQNSEEIVRKRVKELNHATRFWLSIKFYRMDKIDFKKNTKIKSNYSKRKMCMLLGIGENIVKNFVGNTRNKEKSVTELMKYYRYLSPVERNPVRHEAYFKIHASNFENLKVSGMFRSKKSKQINKTNFYNPI